MKFLIRISMKSVQKHLFSGIFIMVLFTCVTILNFDDYQNTTFFYKTLIFNVLSIGLTFYILWKLLKNKQTQITSIDIEVYLLFFYILINTIFRDNISFSLRFYDLLSLFLWYVFLRLFLKNQKIILWIILGLSLAIFINTLYGFGQYFSIFKSFHADFSITGNFFNPAPFSGLIAIGCVLSFAIFLYRKHFYPCFSEIKSKKRITHTLFYGSLLIFSLNAVLLILLKSRASWFAVLIGMTFLLFVHLKSKISSFAKKWLYFSIALGVVIFLFFFYSLRRSSADGRLLVWKVSSEIVKDYPLTGVGLDAFKTHYMNYQAAYFSQNENQNEIILSDNVVYAFNDFLQFTIEQGFIGLFSFLFLLILLVKNRQDIITKIGFAILIVLLVFACFSYPLQILPLKIIGVLGIVFCSFQKDILLKVSLSKTLRAITTIFLLGFIYLQINNIHRLHLGYSHWKKGLNNFFSNDFEESIVHFEKAYPYLKTEGEFLMHYGKTLSVAEQFEQSIVILHQSEKYLNNTVIQIALGDNYKMLKNYDKAEKHYKQVGYMTPNRFYPVYLLAKMYEEKGDLEKAKQQANILLQKPIKIPSMAIFEMQEEMKTLLNQ
ncbi:putative ATP synthase F0, A subunit [Capnocytophaga canis]|nr:putative ATP synthase F0, A subunit [Capnocytophaga canis]